MQDEIKPSVSRRGLLRRASTVAAVAGAAGVASAAIGTPAQAAEGGNLILGSGGDANNTATTKTTLTGGASNVPALKVANANAATPSLELAPVAYATPVVAANLPKGTTWVDEFGNVHVVGEVSATRFKTMSYSPAWATQVIPVDPFRVAATAGTHRNNTYQQYTGYGRTYILEGDGRFTGSKINPLNNASADLTIDLSPLLDIPSDGYIAVQANITAHDHTANGWVAAYGGTYSGTSSLNYGPALYASANFTQTPLDQNLHLTIKVATSVAVIVDVVGFVVNDPFAYGLGVAGSPFNNFLPGSPRWGAAAQGARAAAKPTSSVPRLS